jgi:hypothetical protein
LTKWQPSQYCSNIYQDGGHIVLSARLGKEADYATLKAKALSRSFTDVSFTATVRPSVNAGSGGASFVINGDGSQPQVLVMGPTPDGGVFIEPQTCDRPSCRLSVYEDFTPPVYKSPAISLGEAVPIEIVKRDGHLVFYAKGVELGQTKADPGALDEFWLAMTSGGTDSWDVDIDDLVVR